MPKLLCLFFTVLTFTTAIGDDGTKFKYLLREMILKTKELQTLLKNDQYLMNSQDLIRTPVILEPNCSLICFEEGLTTLKHKCKLPSCKKPASIIISNMKKFQTVEGSQRCEFKQKKIPEFLLALKVFLQRNYKTAQKHVSSTGMKSKPYV